MLEPRCTAEPAIDEMKPMVDELIKAHVSYMAMHN
jgi:hypothetical protein